MGNNYLKLSMDFARVPFKKIIKALLVGEILNICVFYYLLHACKIVLGPIL